MTKTAATPLLERCDSKKKKRKLEISDELKRCSSTSKQQEQQQQLSKVVVVVEKKLKKGRIFEEEKADNISHNDDHVEKNNKETKSETPSHHSTETNVVVDQNKPAEAAFHPLSLRYIHDEQSFISISELLFTQKRDFLVKSNGHVVKAHRLEGKYVLIYVVSLSRYSLYGNHHITADLIDAYNQLLADGRSFEVVLLAATDDDNPSGDDLLDLKKEETNDKLLESWCAIHPEDRFLQLFCGMPWPAVPFWDKECRAHAQTILNLSSKQKRSPFLISLDPNGKVLKAESDWFISDYGAEGFPWSFNSLTAVDGELNDRDHPSLKKLLGSSDRNFLISCADGSLVPISDLENKVVGLYFCHEGYDEETTEKLKVAYHQLKARGENFEVVIIYSQDYVHVNLQSFWENIRSVPWLTLPFRDPKILYLRRVFGFCSRFPKNRLEIIDADGTYNWGIRADDIFKGFGVEAYPFTPKKAVELETEKLRKLTLDSLVDPQVILRRGNDHTQMVSLQELADKRVLLLFAWNLCFKPNKYFDDGYKIYSQFLFMLKKMYRECKGKKDEFEVIYISFDPEEATVNRKSLAKMPWLVHHPFHGGKAEEILERIFEKYVCPLGSALVAFGQDGKLFAKSKDVLGTKMRHHEFPFVDALEKTTLKELKRRYIWD